MITVYFAIAVICFVLFYTVMKISNSHSELSREPVAGLAFILGLFGPILIIVFLLYSLYAYIAYKRNSKK